MSLFIIILAFILIAAGLVWFMLTKDKGEKEPVFALWLAAGFGFIGSIIASTIEHFAVPASSLNGTETGLGAIFLAAVTVGIIEEACKFIPLAIFIYPKKYFNEHTDGIIYFAIAGLAFGVPENILYSLQFGSKVGLTRLVLTPIFHSATTAMAGYFLIKSKIDKKTLLYPALALVGAILLHSFYDFGLASKSTILTVLSLMITAAMTVIFFILFMRSGEVDREEGLSIVGRNNFCRNCGQANPKHLLYCEHCGKRA